MFATQFEPYVNEPTGSWKGQILIMIPFKTIRKYALKAGIINTFLKLHAAQY